MTPSATPTAPPDATATPGPTPAPPLQPRVTGRLQPLWVELWWSPVALGAGGEPVTVTGYEVQWGDASDFMLGAPWPARGTSLAPAAPWQDLSLPAGTGLRRVYRVRALTDGGPPSGSSNDVGVFTYELVH